MQYHCALLARVEHPDYWRNDAAEEKFDDEIREEARQQINSDYELLATLLGERLTGDDLKLIDNRAAFVRQCRDLVAVAIDDHIDTVVRRVYDALANGKYRNEFAPVSMMVQEAIGGSR